MEELPVSRRRVKSKLAFLLVGMYLMGGLLISGLAWASDESELLLARGNKHYLEGKYSEAKAELTRAASLDANNPEILSLLGTTDLALKDYQGAKEAFTQTVALAPNFPRAKLYLGVSNYLFG